MSWKDRILTALITTPDRKMYRFSYGDVEKRIEKKTSKYRFGDIEGSLIQDFGLGETLYPMTLYMSGADYDLQASAFEASAAKKGICILEHPLYGIKDVVIESLQRNDALRTAANQAVFILQMSETIREVIPDIGDVTDFGILSAVNDFYAAIGEAFSNSFFAGVVSDIQNAASRITAFVNEFSAAVDRVTSSVDEVNYAINSARRFITNNIDTLLSSPLALAQSVQSLISSPSLAIATVKDRLNIYKDLYVNALLPITGTNNQNKKNKCAEKEMILGFVAGAMCETVLNPDTGETQESIGDESIDIRTGFEIKSDAINAARELIQAFYVVQNYLDELQIETEQAGLDFKYSMTPAVTERLRFVISQTVKNLVRLSFELAQERRITTMSDRTIIDLCYELYGSSEQAVLDKLIRTNQLTDWDILLVPEKTEIVYYV